MARRGRFRASRRGGRRGGFRRYARRAGVGSSGKLIQIDAMAYGAVRPMVANLIAPVASYLPLGGLSDNVAMGLAAYLVAKKTGGLLRQVAVKGLVIENAMLGSELVGGLTAPTGSSSSSSVMFG